MPGLRLDLQSLAHRHGSGLAQEWPREPDASAKEAEVGGLGRVPPEMQRALLRGRAGTPESIIPMDQRSVMHYQPISESDSKLYAT